MRAIELVQIVARLPQDAGISTHKHMQEGMLWSGLVCPPIVQGALSSLSSQFTEESATRAVRANVTFSSVASKF